MTDPTWSKIPRAQTEIIQATVTSEVKFFIITVGLLTAALATVLLTIWLFYWVRKRKCDILIKGAAQCALAFYQASINNTVLALAGLIVVCTCAVTGRLIFLHYQTKGIFKDLNDQIIEFEDNLGKYLDRAQTYFSLLQSSGIDIDGYLGKGSDNLNKVIAFLKQLETTEIKDEYKKTIDIVRASLKAANIDTSTSDPVAILKQAQAVLTFASPTKIEQINDTVQYVVTTLASFSQAQRDRAMLFLKSLTTDTGTQLTAENFDDMMQKLETFKHFAVYAMQVPDKGFSGVAADAGGWVAQWFKTAIPKGSTASWNT